MPLRILVVDDSVVYRKLVCEALSQLPDVEVVGTAMNGRIAIAKLLDLQPDMVTLDLEMPDMGGLEVLEKLRTCYPGIAAVMISAHTVEGGEATIRALELGAFDFVTKPSAGSLEEGRAVLAQALGSILRAFTQRQEIRAILRGGKAGAAPPPTPRRRLTPAGIPAQKPPEVPRPLPEPVRVELVLIGVSTGGPAALADVVPKLPADFSVPIVIVQHMPPLFTRSLATSLQAKSTLRVKEAENEELLKAGIVYVAPGGVHTKIAVAAVGGRIARLSDDPPENNCRPSVDTLFRSASITCPGRTCAVIMTGMGTDGTIGLRLLKRSGCHVIAQDAASCVVNGMPKSAMEAGVVDVVAPLESIADEIRKAVRG